MRKIAIVGSGITGLIAGHALLRAGFDVTLYSDRTADDWLNRSRPTGTAARFDLALSYERELGLNHWDDVAPAGEGVFLTFCPTLHNRLLHLIGRLERPFQAVDVRLQSARWMDDLAAKGGRVIVDKVDTDKLDPITQANDLTIIAAGRADLCNLFERDEARNPYRERQRKLAMIAVTGCPTRFNEVPFLPVRFDFLGTDGEIFFVPYFHKDIGASWNILAEAKPSSRMDRFDGLTSGDAVVEMMKSVIADLFPWDAAFVRDMKLADPLGWLTGAVVPTVRRASALLPNGRVIAALGDTAISQDPIAAQGANSGVKQTRHFVESLIRRGNQPFNQSFIDETFEEYYNEHARHAFQFSNLLLEPITAPAKELLIAQYGSNGDIANRSSQQQIANDFIENFNDPRLMTPAFSDLALARAAIARRAGGRWLWNGVRGRAGIARNQLKQKLGGDAGYFSSSGTSNVTSTV